MNKVRKAVGAIIIQDNEYLLVHKVKVMDNLTGAVDIEGIWDFSKGGVKESDKDLEEAIIRELKEETGSDCYRIINKFDEKINFSFPKGHRYNSQETVMFYVEYLGDRNDLQPQDEEINQIKFYSKEEIMKIISLNETLNFLDKVSW